MSKSLFEHNAMLNMTKVKFELTYQKSLSKHSRIFMKSFRLHYLEVDLVEGIKGRGHVRPPYFLQSLAFLRTLSTTKNCVI